MAPRGRGRSARSAGAPAVPAPDAPEEQDDPGTAATDEELAQWDAAFAPPDESEQGSRTADAVIADLALATAPAVEAIESLGITRPFTVRAIASFGDILTNRSYKPGDVVPWDRSRAAHYAERELVVIEEG